MGCASSVPAANPVALLVSPAKAEPAPAVAVPAVPAAPAPAAMSSSKRACLICIDGWGLSDATTGNAINQAHTPIMTMLREKAGYAKLDAAGLAVGLPEGLMGNSEVGHLTIGAGQAQYQDLVRINLACNAGGFRTNAALSAAFDRAKAGNGRLHLLGLLSDGGVHSHNAHLYELLAAAKAAGVPRTFVQAILDGRDTPPDSGMGYVKELVSKLEELKYGSIGMLVGRYYMMDRDKRWERVAIAYNALCRPQGEGAGADAAVSSLESKYEAKEMDEFVKPIPLDVEGGVQDGDTLVFFNFRADRMREIVEAVGVKLPFEAPRVPKDISVTQFTQYNAAFPLPAAFPPQSMTNGLSEWVSKKGLRQFHVAETEKYAHVTFFFNGGREEPFPGEDRQMVMSPKVATYDLQPEMAVAEVADALVAKLSAGEHAFAMCNFAPPDMVGHTGMLDKAIIAVGATDAAIGRVYDACQAHGYALFITADHGNAEVMLTGDGAPVTSHTTSNVPFVVAYPPGMPGPVMKRATGTVADVAPTILTYMGLDVPAEMKGVSFI